MYESHGAIVRSKPRWSPWVPLSLVVVGAICAFASVETLGGTLLLWSVYLPALVGVFFIHSKLWRTATARICADADGLKVDESLYGPKTLCSPRIVERGRDTLVTFGRRHSLHSLEIVTANEDDAKALLRALRLDPRHAVTPYSFVGGTERQVILRGTLGLLTMFALIAGPYIVPFRLVPWIIYGLGVPGIATMLFGLGPVWVRIDVGADAVRFRPTLRRSRTVRYDEIEAAEMDGGSLVVRIRGQSPVVACHGGRLGFLVAPRWSKGPEEEAHSFLARLKQHAAEHANRREGSGALLARAGRDGDRWLRAVRDIAGEPTDYRRPAIPRATLWRVVEDASAPLDERVGAAVALRARLNDEGRVRLREIAEASATPQLRVVLESAATAGDDAALVEALDELDVQAGIARSQ